MSGQLEGKVAIITGGSSGMGRATVNLFLKEGAKVVCADIQDDRGLAMDKELGVNFSYFHTDVSDEENMKALVDHTISTFGKLDVMFNNAGFGGANGKPEEIDMQAFDRTIDVLFKGVVLGYKYCVPPMKAQKSGSIISTSSLSAMQAGWGPFVYSACKSAVMTYARSCAMHLAPYFIRSNAIAPGVIPTQIFAEGLNFDLQTSDAFAAYISDYFAAFNPIPRPGSGNDIANAALFLAGDSSSFITGQLLYVDGGVSAGSMTSVGSKMDFNRLLKEFTARRGLDDTERQRMK